MDNNNHLDALYSLHLITVICWGGIAILLKSYWRKTNSLIKSNREIEKRSSNSSSFLAKFGLRSIIMIWLATVISKYKKERQAKGLDGNTKKVLGTTTCPTLSNHILMLKTLLEIYIIVIAIVKLYLLSISLVLIVRLL